MSSAVLPDTEVVSYLFKIYPTALLYLPDIAHWGEVCCQRLRESLERFVVLPYNRGLCAKWAEVTVEAQSRGRRIDCADAWIAATALLAEAPLITHNRRDYLGVSGLAVISHA